MASITARLGKDKDSKSITVEFDLPDDIDGLIQKFGEPSVLSRARAAYVVDLQAFVRGLAREDAEGKTKNQKQIQAAVDEWQPGEKKKGKSPVDKAKDQLDKLSPGERDALLTKMGLA